jgi:LysM repeat protein
MKLPRLPRFPKFKLSRPRKKLEARVRAATAPMADEYDTDEPQTKLSSAFIVVLLLHVVAVGGIYAFNSIKASRRAPEPLVPSIAQNAPKTLPTESTSLATEPRSAASAAVASTSVAPIAPVKPHVYTVKQGDTLTSVSKQFGVTVPDLQAANGLKSDALRIGQVLNVASKGTVKPVETAKLEPAPKKADDVASASGPRTYTVKSGDRLLFIAKRFNVSPDELIAMNKIKDPTKLQIGQPLKLPAKRGN